ncbi:MAG: aldolase [Clostridia bacterium]|nr:aldolase [Clostridia bacterium]
MHLRKSKVIAKTKEGKCAFSFKLNLSDPRCAEIAAMSGIDCLWIDMEHVPSDYSAVENIVRAAKAYDVDVLCRVSRGGYSDLICPLEADCTGIMVPHLMSLEEAKKVVYYTKFHPIGRRPLDGGNADGAYCLVDALDYIKEANEERFTIVQIEDPEPVAELEEICALPGIDMIFFGPADFSQGIGKPCQFDAPEIDETRKLVAKLARKHGKMAGTTGSVATAEARIAEGYNFINVGADVIALGNYFMGLKKELDEKFN